MNDLNEFKKVELWYEPTDNVRENKDGFICEMSRYDHGFLSGIIKMAKPARILEIGVAEGGTTEVIAKTVEMLDLNCDIISVDLNEKLYCNKEYKTGYIYSEEKSENIRHKFLFGKTIAGQIEKIYRGGGIDVVVLDTTHHIPGEILDFISILPFMSKNGIIVCHDVNLNYGRGMNKETKKAETTYKCIATKVLFLTVVAEKYFNYDDDYRKNNIAAFRITEDTYKHSIDLFYALTMTWSYNVSSNLLSEYKQLFEKFYSDECMDIFNTSINMNDAIHKNMQKIEQYMFPYEKIPYNSRIILYGAGRVGKYIYSLLDKIGYSEVVGFVDTYYEKYRTIDVRDALVEKPESILEKEFDYIVVAVDDVELFNEIKEYIVKNNLNKGKLIIGPIKRRL